MPRPNNDARMREDHHDEGRDGRPAPCCSTSMARSQIGTGRATIGSPVRKCLTQVVGQCDGRVIALPRVFFEAFQRDRLEVPWQAGDQPRRRTGSVA